MRAIGRTAKTKAQQQAYHERKAWLLIPHRPQRKREPGLDYILTTAQLERPRYRVKMPGKPATLESWPMELPHWK